MMLTKANSKASLMRESRKSPF
uniref:Uncharacterized protein n=1 Tax=Anguilla anguilla TaxID=7936 RepID=A0A0E9VFK9_ANGAN